LPRAQPGNTEGLFGILSNTNGQFFGIGSAARDPIWVEINVQVIRRISSGYDFTSNVCSAEWRSTVGVLAMSRHGWKLKRIRRQARYAQDGRWFDRCARLIDCSAKPL